MVWIHGGAFTIGSRLDVVWYDGARARPHAATSWS